MKLSFFILKTSTFLVSSCLVISCVTASCFLIEEKNEVRNLVQRIVEKHNNSLSIENHSSVQENKTSQEDRNTKSRKPTNPTLANEKLLVGNISSFLAHFGITGVNSISSCIDHFSINTITSNNSDFISNIIGTGINSKDIPSRLQQAMKSDDFLPRLHTNLTPQMQSFLEHTKTVYGSNPRD